MGCLSVIMMTFCTSHKLGSGHRITGGIVNSAQILAKKLV